MPNWIPKKQWKDRDVYIIGGGPSLEGFDWELLREEYTIGCNSAFRLGYPICNMCIFGDAKFWDAYQEELLNFTGPVFTNCATVITRAPQWLYTSPRKNNGLFTDALGWAGNTGSSAINLAIQLGAKRVLLLGFDMALNEEGQNNWHKYGLDNVGEAQFTRFKNGFKGVVADWKEKFSEVEIINLNPQSALTGFPKMSFEDFYENRKAS